MKVHVTTVSTSLLDSARQNGDVGRIVSGLGLGDWGTLRSDDERQDVIARDFDALIEVVLNYLRRVGLKSCTGLDPVFSAMRRFGHRADEVYVLIYVADVWNAKLVGEAVREYLRGRRIRSELVAVKAVSSGESFYAGVEDLFDKVVYRILKFKEQGNEVYINATPGPKPETVFLSVAGLLAGADAIYYKYPDTDEVVVLPSPPIKLDPKYSEWLAALAKEGPTVSRKRAEELGVPVDLLERRGLVEREGEDAYRLRGWARKMAGLYPPEGGSKTTGARPS
ncbi:MAG: putative CRISPR-associated protein [Thermoprotei archaeon]